MNDRELENFYREHLEEDIIFCLSQRHQISLEKAMEMYYFSQLADRINAGTYGIQYLDASVLADFVDEKQQYAAKDI